MSKFLQARRRPGKHRKRRWEAKSRKLSDPNPTRAENQVPVKRSWNLTLIPVECLRFFSVKNAVDSLVKVLISWYWWIHNSVKRHLLLIKNTIFPSLLCQRELRTLRQRLQKLEAEFSKLQSSLLDKSMDSSFSERPCCCRCNHPKPLSPAIAACPPPAKQYPPPFHSSAPPPPAPPPPPPPPPAPPLPPAFLFQKRLPVLKKAESTKAPKEATVRQDGPVQITLKDLLNVKLRKTRQVVEKQKVGLHQHKCIPSISFLESQGVNLKIGTKMPPRRLANIFKETLNRSPLDFRKRLKKVNMVRSPGGTPVYDRDKENGTGLTPLMTKALRQKFQLAHPKSPSPLLLSPGNRSFEEVY
ncbi:proline-rich protein 11 [Rhinophrynus dorsalis]